MNDLLNDDAEITWISFGNEPDGTTVPHSVGHDGITKITVTKEPGPAGHYAWFAIHDKDGIRRRVNSMFVAEVGYD